MTDKLADAIKTLKDHNEWRRGVEGYEMCDPATLGRAIDLVCEAAHEAAKAAAPDDVRETILDLQNRIEYRQKLIANNFAANNFITVDIPDLQTLINAALRQGVTIDVYAELIYLRYCHSIGAAGADWNAVECKDVWREKALLDQHARGG